MNPEMIIRPTLAFLSIQQHNEIPDILVKYYGCLSKCQFTSLQPSQYCPVVHSIDYLIYNMPEIMIDEDSGP